jgi:hypothetical protein
MDNLEKVQEKIRSLIALSKIKRQRHPLNTMALALSYFVSFLLIYLFIEYWFFLFLGLVVFFIVIWENFDAIKGKVILTSPVLEGQYIKYVKFGKRPFKYRICQRDFHDVVFIVVVDKDKEELWKVERRDAVMREVHTGISGIESEEYFSVGELNKIDENDFVSIEYNPKTKRVKCEERSFKVEDDSMFVIFVGGSPLWPAKAVITT